MRKNHYKNLRTHLIFSLCLAAVAIALLAAFPQKSLWIAGGFITLYVGVNGWIHQKNRTLTREVTIEYLLLVAIAGALLIAGLS